MLDSSNNESNDNNIKYKYNVKRVWCIFQMKFYILKWSYFQNIQAKFMESRLLEGKKKIAGYS